MFPIEIKQLQVIRDNIPVISDLTLNIKKGDVIGIIGNNGSGKTTLAYTLTGIIPHHYYATIKGDISVENKSILNNDFQDRLKIVSCSFQDPDSQFLFGTVKEIFDVFSQILLKSIELWDIGEVLEREPQNLSGGEKQCITLLFCLTNNAPLLIFDEATTALDIYSRSIFGKFITLLKDNGFSIILLSQRLSNIQPFCQKILFLYNGKLEKNYYSIEDTNEVNELVRKSLEIVHIKQTQQQPELYKANINNINIFKNKVAGEIVFIIGKNASGKTTKILNIINSLAKSDVKLSLLLQNPSYQLSQANSLSEIFEYQRPENDYAFNILKELFPFISPGKDPFEYSYGEQKILIMLNCFLSNANLILLDEPEQGLDDCNLKKVEHFIRLLRDEYKKKIIIISHDMDFLCRIADAYFYLDRENIKYSDTISYTNIKDLFFE